jgi:hypothetical protein
MIENIGYKIRVVKPNATARPDLKDHDITKPIKSRGDNGEYFHLNLEALPMNVNGLTFTPQSGTIRLMVFNSSDQKVTFNAIADALSDPKNYVVAANGDIVIDKSVQGIMGAYVTRNTPFDFYSQATENGKVVPYIIPAGRPNAGNKIINNSVAFFVCSWETEEARMAIEIRRAKRTMVPETIPAAATKLDENLPPVTVP